MIIEWMLYQLYKLDILIFVLTFMQHYLEQCYHHIYNSSTLFTILLKLELVMVDYINLVQVILGVVLIFIPLIFTITT